MNGLMEEKTTWLTLQVLVIYFCRISEQNPPPPHPPLSPPPPPPPFFYFFIFGKTEGERKQRKTERKPGAGGLGCKGRELTPGFHVGNNVVHEAERKGGDQIGFHEKNGARHVHLGCLAVEVMKLGILKHRANTCTNTTLPASQVSLTRLHRLRHKSNTFTLPASQVRANTVTVPASLVSLTQLQPASQV